MRTSTQNRAPAGGIVGPLWVTERPGCGRPLVLLHGNSESHRVFDRLVTRLPGRNLIGLDSRGHGLSPRGAGDLSIAAMAADVAEVLALLDRDDVDVLGFSDGGNIALQLALDHPGVAHRLLLCGANLDPDGLGAVTVRQLRAAKRLAELLVPAWSGARPWVERLSLMTDDPHIAPESLRRVAVPVLVVAGQHDAVRRSHTELIAASLPDARLEILAHAGHAIPWRSSDRLAALVDDFFVD